MSMFTYAHFVMKNGENPSMKNCKKRRKHETKVRNNKIFKRKKGRRGFRINSSTFSFLIRPRKVRAGAQGETIFPTLTCHRHHLRLHQNRNNWRRLCWCLVLEPFLTTDVNEGLFAWNRPDLIT